MTSHPLVRKISFTGSVATGKKVAAAAAPDLKRVTLELGGNDPAIVLDDVDTEKVAEKLFWSAFRNSGQVCIAIKRVYVPERLHDDLVDALAARARAAKVGDGMAEGTDLGPINNKPQFERVQRAGRRRAEQRRDRGGRRRAAGPARLLLRADRADRRVRRHPHRGRGAVRPGPAGDPVPGRGRRAGPGQRDHFGLGGSVWSADPDRAADVAERLETGTAWVNTHAALAPHQPFGGAKWSGIGVENGSWGLLGYTEIQVVHRSKR